MESGWLFALLVLMAFISAVTSPLAMVKTAGAVRSSRACRASRGRRLGTVGRRRAEAVRNRERRAVKAASGCIGAPCGEEGEPCGYGERCARQRGRRDFST